jgi:hypothetical protein
MPYNFPHTTWPNYTLKIANTEYSCLFGDRSLFFRRSAKSTFLVGSCRRSNSSRQIVPVLSSIFLLFSAFSSQALTTPLTTQVTRNVINGSALYLTFDGGRTRATDVNDLLWIALPGGTKITSNTNPSSRSNPIQLPNAGDDFTNIDMLVPVGSNTVSLNALIGPPNNYWADDDGDGQGSGGVTATGSLTLSIVDKAGHAVDRRDTLTICNAPYEVTLSSSGGTLSTRYGFPKSRSFSARSATYYISPKASPAVCFARPNLEFGRASDNASSHGPSNIWNPAKGFLTQSTDPAHYDFNFPTTGAHNLYFDLDIGGVDATSLTWPDVVHPSGITVKLSVTSATTVRATLVGPVATSAQISSSSPGNIPRPPLPATFELVGRDSSGRAIITYGFELKQWFVNRGDNFQSYATQNAWCSSIGYQMPRVRDLTNAVCSSSEGYPISGATPPSSRNNYMRHIDAGFFSEWGDMGGYTGASFAHDSYWTSDASGSYQFAVDSYGGNIGWGNPSYSSYVVCASVLRP